MATTTRRSKTATRSKPTTTAPPTSPPASRRGGTSGTTRRNTGRNTGRDAGKAAGDAILHLDRWIRENRKHLKPPVSNRQLFTESDDAIVFVSGGPNTRNDYHVNPTEELFHQLKGDIAVRIRPLDGSPPRDVVIREGELYLLPRWVPHRPQRPAGTIGLIIEFPRPKGEKDGLRWYCPECDELVHEARWRLKKIDEDLKVIMERFWGGPAKRRTCKSCGHVIERAGEFRLASQGKRTARNSPRKTARKTGRKTTGDTGRASGGVGSVPRKRVAGSSGTASKRTGASKRARTRRGVAR